MADWTSIVDRIVRAEQDVKVAKELLHRAEADEKAARADLARMMGRQPTRAQQIIAEALNGGGHSPSHAPRRRSD
jgi:outer membrane protein TolC